jgi:hypothetical protein
MLGACHPGAFPNLIAYHVGMRGLAAIDAFRYWPAKTSGHRRVIQIHRQ